MDSSIINYDKNSISDRYFSKMDELDSEGYRRLVNASLSDRKSVFQEIVYLYYLNQQSNCGYRCGFKDGKSCNRCALIQILKEININCEKEADEIIKNKECQQDWLYNEDGSVNQESVFWKQLVTIENSAYNLEKKFIRPGGNKCCENQRDHVCRSSNFSRLKRITGVLDSIADSKEENKNFIKRYLMLLCIWRDHPHVRQPYLFSGIKDVHCEFEHQVGDHTHLVTKNIFEDDYEPHSEHKLGSIKFSLCNLMLLILFDTNYTASKEDPIIYFDADDEVIEKLKLADSPIVQILQVLNSVTSGKTLNSPSPRPYSASPSSSQYSVLKVLLWAICAVLFVILMVKLIRKFLQKKERVTELSNNV